MTAANPDSPQATELPALECDLVMKGGITSGLVYPKAVVRVARDYRIRDIGGTSIGAIAAALTAAAEYWRHAHPTAAGVQQAKIDTLFRDLPDNPTEAELIEHLDAREGQFIGGGPNDTGRDVRGFAGLYQIPKEVGADLMGKFQPQFWTSGLFTFATGLMGLSNPVALLAYVLFRRFIYVRTILAAVFVLVAITARLNPTHGQIFLGLILGLALLFYLVFFARSLVKAGKPSWQGPWIGLTWFIVVTTAALAICWAAPQLPDPPEVWGWARSVLHRLYPRWEIWEVWVPFGIVLAVLAVCKLVYTNEWFAGLLRSTILAVFPLAAIVVAAGVYTWVGGGFAWIDKSVLQFPAIRDLIIHILVWILALIALSLVRDIYLNNAVPIGRLNLKDQRRMGNALVILLMVLLTGWLLRTDQDTIGDLATDSLIDFTTAESQAVPDAPTPAEDLVNRALTIGALLHETTVEVGTIMTLKSADTIGTILVGGTIGWILGLAAAVLYGVLVAIPENYYGLCTGMGSNLRKDKALTNWLTGKIDDVAEPLPPEGGASTNPHLTIGDLAVDGELAIKLEMITSDVDRGVPLKLPAGLGNYRFDPNEFRQFFPGTIVDWMTGTDGNVDVKISECEIETKRRKGYRKLLCTFADQGGSVDHLPVIVIARMSMSFPVLFSAVPVYYQKDPDSPWRRHYLSDGGIVSNFPIHLFDRALSPRPTFAIDLVDRNVDSMPETLDHQYSTSPIRPKPGMAAMTTLVQDAATGRLSGFLNDIVNTARGWLDKSQATLPGYKERIVGIHLYKEQGEGGLNLSMEADMITRLANRGLYGMHRFLETWKPDLGSESEWHQHRWLRYVILMRSLENFRQEWERGYACDSAPVHTPSVKDMVSQQVPMDTPYPVPQPLLAQAQAMAGQFDQFADGGHPTASNCGKFGVPIPDGVFDEVAGLKGREPQLLVIPPFK